MKMFSRPLQLGRLALCVTLLTLLVQVNHGKAWAVGKQANVLILNSYHQGDAWSDNEVSGILSELHKHSPSLAPSIEYLDTKRFPGPEYLDFTRKYLKTKYHGRPMDLIIALDNPALEVLGKNDNMLFAEVPVVFAGINDYHPAMLAGRRNITGVVQRIDIAGTLAMALSLHPKASQILAINDYTASGRAVRREMEAALARVSPKPNIILSRDVPFTEMQRDIEAMPGDGVVLLLSYVTDQTGQTFSREESTRIISAISPAPVYSIHETSLGFGIVGGMLLDGKDHGRQAGVMATRIIQGEDPSQIAIAESSLRYMFDDQALRRFQIPGHLLPAGAIVINRPETLWSRHRNVLIPALSAICLLSLLFAVLLGMVLRLRRAKAAIKESELLFKSLFEGHSAAKLIIDPASGRIVDANPAATVFYGWSREELKDMFIQQINTEPPGSVRQAMENAKELKQIRFQFHHKTADGSLREVEVFSSSVDVKGKNLLHSVIHDITGQVRAEEEQKKLEAQLRQAQKMEAIGSLAGGIAHDFNNVLGAILGYAELAKEDSPAESAVTRDIEQIILAGNRAKDLVKQILAFSRQGKSEKIPLYPAFIIKETVKLLRASLPATITILPAIDTKAGPILADPTELHQLTMNLCTNAFHAMEELGGTLSITLTSEPAKKVICLSVRDNGPGIAPEIKERIFDPYFTTKETGKGTGMGLAIVHGIVAGWGGTITCDSHPGQGTTFHITLPIYDEIPTPKEDKVGKDDQIPAGAEHILLIDDEEILVNMSRTMLERLGYRVTIRNNSLEALTLFQNQPETFDLVITDQTMPAMTGIDLARRMLQIRPNLPIILCTGYSSILSEDAARTAGIKGFAMKPITKKEIALLIRQVLNTPNASQ